MTHRRVSVVSFLALGTIVLAGLMMTLAVFWLVYPYQPLTVHTSEILGPHTVEQGDILPLRITYTKRQDIEGVGVRSFQDGISFSTPSIKGRIPPGENLSILREVPVPLTLPPGVYSLRNVVSFKVNPLRTVDYAYDTETFTVTAGAHPDAEQDKE